MNLVWREHADAPLLTIARAEAAATVAQPCTSRAEFAHNLHAVYTLFERLRLPGETKDRQLVDLRTYLQRQLGADSPSSDAISILQCVLTLRTAGAHAIITQDPRRAAGQLGIDYPVVDYASTWETIRRAVVDAVAILRQESEALPRRG